MFYETDFRNKGKISLGRYINTLKYRVTVEKKPKLVYPITLRTN